MPGSDPKYRRKRTKLLTKRALKKKGIAKPDEWSYSHKCRIGEYLLEVAQIAQICRWSHIRKGKKVQNTIELTHEFEQMLLSIERTEIDNAYETHPLIDVPLDWQPSAEPGRFNKTGGYHLPLLRHQQPMCRGKGIHDSVFGAKSASLQNTLQRTAWRVDPRVLNVAEQLHGRFNLSGRCSSLNLIVRSKVVQLITSLKTVSCREWRRDRARMHESYNDQYRRSLRTLKAIGMAGSTGIRRFTCRGSSIGVDGSTTAVVAATTSPLTLRSRCCGFGMAADSAIVDAVDRCIHWQSLSGRQLLNAGTRHLDLKNQR